MALYDVFTCDNNVAGTRIGTVDFNEPLGLLPRAALQKIDAMAVVMSRTTLTMDWKRMVMFATGFSNTRSVTDFFCFKRRAPLKKDIPDIRWCSCGGSVDFERCNLVCSKCKKSFGGIS
jgi:hypothetical protein